jgi:large conductance mechanosensitive channel
VVSKFAKDADIADIAKFETKTTLALLPAVKSTDTSMLEEFKKFALRGNVIDLAVGVIVGASFTGIVTSLVKDVIMPPIGWITGGIDFSNFFLVLKGDAYTTLADAQKAGAITINYGQFLTTVINFLIVAFVVFLLVRQINRLFVPKPASTPASPEDVLLLREIRDLLKERT